ncbi:MAG: branched-chain amino acid ABC transporter permease [Burkholderiales bacterium]|nr:branched-chain amino acid ABC transporter permease [Burkholderiales bacterium]
MTLRRVVAVTVIASVAIATFPWILSDFALSLALTCIMYAGLTVSWAMFSGVTNYLSLATAFFGIGAYVTAWGLGTVPYALLVPAGGLLAAAFAALVGAGILHLRGAYFAVLTFGLGELVRHAITYAEKTYAHTVGRVLVDAPETTIVFWTVLAVAALAVIAAFVVRANRFGLALAGIGSDEARAETLGVNTRRAKIVGFALSAFFAGALGAAMAVRWTYIEPNSVFNPFIGFQTVLIAMVGGASTIVGPLAASVVFSLLTEFLRLQFPYLFLMVLGALLILLVLYLPGGLASLWPTIRARFARGAARG